MPLRCATSSLWDALSISVYIIMCIYIIYNVAAKQAKQTMHGGGLKHSFHALLSDCWTGSSWPPATLHSHPHLSRALPKVEERALSADRYRMVQVHGDAMGDMDEKWWKPIQCQSASLQKLFEIAFQNSNETEALPLGRRTDRYRRNLPMPRKWHRLDDALNWKTRKRNENAGNYIRFHVDKGLYSILSKHQLWHSLPGGWRAKMRNAVNLKGGSFWKRSNVTSAGYCAFPWSLWLQRRRISCLNFEPRYVLWFYNLRSSAIIDTVFSSLRFQVAVASPNPNPRSGQCEILSSPPARLSGFGLSSHPKGGWPSLGKSTTFLIHNMDHDYQIYQNHGLQSREVGERVSGSRTSLEYLWAPCPGRACGADGRWDVHFAMRWTMLNVCQWSTYGVG